MSPTRLNVVRSVLASAAALGLTACGGEVIAASDATVLVSERTGAGMDALGSGRLELVGGCLGAGGFVIVWPHGTDVVEQDPLTVDVTGYGTYAVGDRIEIAGGFVLEHSSDNVEPGPYETAGVTVPAECAEHDVFVAH